MELACTVSCSLCCGRGCRRGLPHLAWPLPPPNLLTAMLHAASSTSTDGKHPRSDAAFFQRREFCFTLDGDIFVRYQSFKVSLGGLA